MGFLDNVINRLGLQARNDAAEEHTDSAADGDSYGGFVNLLTRLGVSTHDSTVTTTYSPRTPFTDAERGNLYAYGGIAARIVYLAVLDARRKGYTLPVRDAEPEIGDAIKHYLAKIPVTVTQLDTMSGDLTALEWATIWSRVYGGGLIALGLRDGRPASEPVDLERLQAIDFMRVAARTHVRVVKRFNKPDDPRHGTVELWEVYDYERRTSVVFHADRVLVINGHTVPPGSITDAQHADGWGTSVYDLIRANLQAALSSEQVAAAMAQRSAFGVWFRKGLFGLLKAGQGNALLARLQTQVAAISSLRALILDKDQEDFKPLSFDFTGLVALLEAFPYRVAADTGYPVSHLYSNQVGGLNSGANTGDRSNYHEGTVKAGIQESKWRAPLERLVVLAQQCSEGPTGGVVYDVAVEWAPLQELTEKEQAEVRAIQARTDQTYVDLGVLRPDEVRASRFGGRQWSADTTITEGAGGETP